MAGASSHTKESRNLLIVFAVMSIAGGVGNCSQTAVNAMLNEMSVDMGVMVATSQWLTNGYTLAWGVSTLLAAYLLKRFSERWVVMASLVLMAAGSLLIIVCPLFPVALTARVLQASGVGLIIPTLQTLIMVDLPRQRIGTYMGIFGVCMGFMVNFGPTVGGTMATAWGWRSFFWLFFVVAVVLLVPAYKAGRTQSGGLTAGKFDIPSFLLSSFAFIGILLGFSNASSLGLTSVWVWIPVAAGALLLVLFVLRQNKMDHPLVDMSIFKDRRYVAGFAVYCLLYISFVGITLVIPLYVEDLKGGTALDAGMVMLPACVMALLANLGAGIMQDRVGAVKVLRVTSCALVIGAVLAILCDETTPLWFLAAAQTVRTLGVSGSIGPITGWSLENLPRKVVSDGSVFLTVGRQAFASLGTSIMVLLITAFTAAGDSVLAFRAAFAFSAVFALAMMVTLYYFAAKEK